MGQQEELNEIKIAIEKHMLKYQIDMVKIKTYQGGKRESIKISYGNVDKR